MRIATTFLENFSHGDHLFKESTVLGVCSSERAQKMLQNDVLDVEKFADTAENEAFEVP